MPDPSPADWMTAWAETQQELLRHGVGAEALRRFREFGDDYLGVTRELWKLIECGLSSDPGLPPQALNESLQGLRAGFRDGFEKLYRPAFEPLCAPQETHERLMTATLRWQRAAQSVNERLAVVAARAVDDLVAALGSPDATGPPVTSLRELHDLWVECGERAYASAAHDDEFGAAQAELLAAMVELRFEQRRQLEHWARAFNLPTRAEIDAIHERLHSLSRLLREERGR